MPTSRNARGVDVVIYSQDGLRKITLQVKALSKRDPVPLGETLETLIADFVVICNNVASGNPTCFVLTGDEVRENAHEGIKNGKKSYWLQQAAYRDFEERWDRVGSGLVDVSATELLRQRPPSIQGPPLESLRRQFKPDKINVLLVGESPPAGGSFFYQCNSNLFRYTKEAFKIALGTEFRSDSDFLKMFQKQGYYLDDLHPDALDDLNDDVRKRRRSEAIGPLTERIRSYGPSHVIVVMMGVEREVKEAASRASIPPGRIYSLPFPSTGNQRRYVDGLVKLLRGIQTDKGG